MAVQAASLLPAAQLLPGVAEVTVLARILFPVSGLLTVTENVIVAAAPTARFPVQVRFGLVKLTWPDGRGGVVVVGRVIKHPGQRVGERRPGIRRLPEFVTVTV